MIVGYWTGYNPEGSIKLPDTIVSNGEEYKIIEIGDYAFVNCTRLINVELPAYLQTIGEYAFKGCENLLSVKFPSGLEEIEKCAFFDCKNLLSIMLPDSLKKIGTQAFSGCGSLTAVVIPPLLTKLESVFSRCENLKVAVLGEHLEWLNNCCFNNDYKLQTLYSLSSTPPENWGNAFSTDYVSPSDPGINDYWGYTTLYAPQDGIEAYENCKPNYGIEYNYFKEIDKFLPLPDVFIIFSADKFMVEEGMEFPLEYYLFNIANVEIESEEWSSFNDRAVQVKDGIVKGLRAGEMTHITYTITDVAGKQYSGECRVEVMPNTRVGSIGAEDLGVDGVYGINGMRVGDTTDGLLPGFYIVKQGGCTRKIIVR